MKSYSHSLRSYKLSVDHLSIELMRNRLLSEKWLLSKKDFFSVHVVTPYGVNPLIDCYDFAFLSFAEAARFSTMFSCLPNTRIVISLHHFTNI